VTKGKSGSGAPVRRPLLRTRFRKRSHLVAEEIKAWIVSEDMKPGDRLPAEKALIEAFGVSRGTMREALRALETQGLVRLVTGPAGGPLLIEVPEERAMELLGSYFYFRTLTAADIYQVRCILEPELAVAAVGHLTEAHFARLEQLIGESSITARTPEARRRQRTAELEFHNVIADACPNEWLAFVGRFMNRLLNDLIVFKKLYVAPHQEFAHANRRSHLDLIDAFRRENRKAVRTIMQEHMVEASRYMRSLHSTIDRAPLLDVLGRQSPLGRDRLERLA
jgi:DNA-binding FadR family transcriptional regulator